MKKLFTLFAVAVLCATFSLVTAQEKRKNNSRLSGPKIVKVHQIIPKDIANTKAPVKGYEPNPIFIGDGPEALITIGSGTTTGTYPFYMYWGYTRSASIYTSTEIGSTGIITTLAWYVSTAAAASCPIVIYLKTTTSSTFTSSTWASLTTGATLVYSGTRSFSTTGWNTITLSTPFNYTGSNLMVLCEANYGGGGTSPYPYFYRYNVTSTHQTWYQDNTPPTGTGTIANTRPQIQMNVTPSTTPYLSAVPTSLSFGNVVAGQTSAEKTYSLSGGSLTGFPGNIIVTAPANFQVSLTSGSGFGSSINVPYSSATLSATAIYVRFQPPASTAYSGNVTNAGGGATTVNVAVSGTGVTPLTLPITENFDLVTAPALPAGWSYENTNGDANYWITNTSSPNTTPNSMFIQYNSAAAMNDWFFTPPILLTAGKTYQVGFQYKNNGGTTYPEKLEVKWGTTASSAGMTSSAIFSNSNITNLTYLTGTGSFPISVTGYYYVGWHGFSAADMYDLFVDDVTIQEALNNDISVVAVFAKGKLPLGFGANDTMKAVISNFGIQTQTNIQVTLNVSGANSFTNTTTYPSLAPGATDTVTFAPFTSSSTGTNTVTASVPGDQNNANNSKSYSQIITTNTFAYSDGSPMTLNLGYNTGSGTLLTRYYVTGTAVVNSVNCYIGDYTYNTGNTVYGILENAAGTIVAQTANYVILSTDLGTWHTFNFTTNPVIGDQVFYIGMGQTANTTTGYYPLGTQTESPGRNNAYYGNALTGGAFTMYNSFGRMMIEAVVSAPTSPSLVANPLTINFGYTANGNTSSEQSYVISGMNLNPPDGNITVTAPPNFQISQTSGSGYLPSLNIPYSVGSLTSTTIYGVFQPTSEQDYSGNIVNSGGGAANVNVSVSGTSNILYCTSGAVYAEDDDIGNVTFGTINNGVATPVINNPTAVNTYTNFYSSVAPTNIQQGTSYPISVSGIWQATAYTAGVSVYIDFNKNGTFDASDGFYLGTVDGTTNTITGNITVPAGATLGNTRMRVILVEGGSSLASACGTYAWGETEDYRVNIVAASPMTYSSSIVTQSVTTSVSAGSTNAQIIGVQVVTSGSASPLNIYSLTFDVCNPSSGGTTNINDIQNAKVYYTGGSGTFGISNLFGTYSTSIPSYPSSFTISNAGGQALVGGTNYFWLTYDLIPCATIGNVLDAECTSFTIGSGSPGISQTPSTVSPAGSRLISASSDWGGPLAGYYFSNSSPGSSCALSQPVFSWFDTTGSINLILNSVNQGTLTGTIDDGYYTITLPAGKIFRFMGTNYTTIQIATNGYVTLGTTGYTSYSPVSLPSTSAPLNSIFALWNDIRYDYQTSASYNRLSYKFIPADDHVIITFNNAPIEALAATTRYVSFQIILNTSDSPIDNSPFVIQFDDAQSGTGWKDLSTGWYYTNGKNHLVGFQSDGNAGNGMMYRFVNSGPANPSGRLISSPVAIGFSPNQSTLPVELSAFSASVNIRDVKLNWTTSKETNNKCFEIERKTENGIWAKLSSVNGKGTTNSKANYSFDDNKLQTGKYFYRLKQIDLNGNYKYFQMNSAVSVGIPTKFNLSQNYPNPFNPVTKIDFDLPFDSKVKLIVFDILGREVKKLINGDFNQAGYYTIELNATNLASGIYFYRFAANALNGKEFNSVKKMAVIK